jgi:hypothetical protein
MTGQIRCRECDRPLRWFATLKVVRPLCLPCLQTWLAEQRERENA